MQNNQTPNASIPPSEMPANSPEQKKSNTGLIIAIVLIVIAFVVQFLMPFFLVFLASTSLRDFFEDFDDDFDWSYEGEDFVGGSSDFKGYWSGDNLYLGFSPYGSYNWLETSDEVTVNETGDYIATSDIAVLKKLDKTEEEIASLLHHQDDFDVRNLYSIELFATSSLGQSDEVKMSHQLLIYHASYYRIEVYDLATERSYELVWQHGEQTNKAEPDNNEDTSTDQSGNRT